jgi:hypothetical protein
VLLGGWGVVWGLDSKPIFIAKGWHPPFTKTEQKEKYPSYLRNGNRMPRPKKSLGPGAVLERSSKSKE